MFKQIRRISTSQVYKVLQENQRVKVLNATTGTNLTTLTQEEETALYRVLGERYRAMIPATCCQCGSALHISLEVFGCEFALEETRPDLLHCSGCKHTSCWGCKGMQKYRALFDLPLQVTIYEAVVKEVA